MRNFQHAVVVACTAVGATFAAPVQQLSAQPSVAVGMRVRVWLADSARTHYPAFPSPSAVGSVAALTPAALQLEIANSGARLSVSFASIERIERSQGRHSRTVRGAVIGGAVSALAFDGLVCAFANGKCAIGGEVAGFLLYTATGAVPGAIIGGRIGSHHFSEEQWEQAWPPR